MITDARVMNSGFAAELDPGYAAIEQYSREGSIGSWTDVYAFGAVTYRMLVGSTPQEAVQRVANDKLMFPQNLPRFYRHMPSARCKAPWRLRPTTARKR